MGRGFAAAVLVIGLALPQAGLAQHRHRGIPLPYPELLHPAPWPSLPEGFALRQDLPAAPLPAGQRLNLPREISRKIAENWLPPGSQEGRTMVATVRLSFRVDGSVIGEPMFTYVNAASGSAARADIEASLRDAIRRSNPLPFTAGLGNAIAGRVITIRFGAGRGKPHEIPA